MIRSSLMIAVACFVATNAPGQNNLVPNPDFEAYGACPTFESQLYQATPWNDAGMIGTPDYYHPCGTLVMCQAPVNNQGEQPARSGVAYAGFYSMQWPNEVQMVIREYLRVQLADPMVAGTAYCVSFYLSLGDVCLYATNSIGVHFGMTDEAPVNGWASTLIPQLETPDAVYFTDKENWMLVSGTYEAQGGEQYMTIGNFHQTDDDVGLQETTGDVLWTFSYYYIDDVSVTGGNAVPNPCSFPTAIPLQAVTAGSMRIAPNPASTGAFIEIPGAGAPRLLELYDATGALVRSESVQGARHYFARGDLPTGLYILTLKEVTGERRYRERIVID